MTVLEILSLFIKYIKSCRKTRSGMYKVAFNTSNDLYIFKIFIYILTYC